MLLAVFATAIFALAPTIGAVQPLVVAPAKITVGQSVGLLVNGAATAGGLKVDLVDSTDSGSCVDHRGVGGRGSADGAAGCALKRVARVAATIEDLQNVSPDDGTRDAHGDAGEG